MPLEWRKTSALHEGRAVQIEHLAKVDANDILEALAKKPLETRRGFGLGVERMPFKPYSIAVRKMPHDDARKMFETLKKLAEAKIAIVEMPVALIERQNPIWLERSSRAVTVWKEKTRPFEQFLRDPKITFKEKLDACLGTVRLLAKLHAEGFLHGHLKPMNFVINERHSPALVDFKLLNEVVGNEIDERGTDFYLRSEMQGWATDLSNVICRYEEREKRLSWKRRVESKKHLQ